MFSIKRYLLEICSVKVTIRIHMYIDDGTVIAVLEITVS